MDGSLLHIRMCKCGSYGFCCEKKVTSLSRLQLSMTCSSCGTRDLTFVPLNLNLSIYRSVIMPTIHTNVRYHVGMVSLYPLVKIDTGQPFGFQNRFNGFVKSIQTRKSQQMNFKKAPRSAHTGKISMVLLPQKCITFFFANQAKIPQNRRNLQNWKIIATSRLPSMQI